MNISSIVFYNNCNNGDIHYSREYIKYFAKVMGVPCAVNHTKCPRLLIDTNIPFVSTNLWSIHTSGLHYDNNTLFMNTWVGQEGNKWLQPYGCTLKNNHRMFMEKAETLGISLLPEEEYIPSIDYSAFGVDEIQINTEKNVFVSNGNVMSGQGKNFDLDSVVVNLARKHPSCTFYVTQAIATDLPNVVDANTITRTAFNVAASNLNELSYVSTFCDIIVGRASGPFCFTHTKQNLLDSKKTFIAAANVEREGHWVFLDDYTMTSRAKQIWYESHVHKNNDCVSEVFAMIDGEIHEKFGNR